MSRLRLKKQECVSCGALVPEVQFFPYPGHRKDCTLVRQWIGQRWTDALESALDLLEHGPGPMRRSLLAICDRYGAGDSVEHLRREYLSSEPAERGPEVEE